jgi:hypothetical protein
MFCSWALNDNGEETEVTGYIEDYKVCSNMNFKHIYFSDWY